MSFEELRAYCLSFPGVEEAFPFGGDTLVFSVGGKMFLLINIDKLEFFNVKCEPEKAIELREQYADITPGYHMNKRHWNSISLLGQLSTPLMKECIQSSYSLVYSTLPKKVKDLIK